MIAFDFAPPIAPGRPADGGDAYDPARLARGGQFVSGHAHLDSDRHGAPGAEERVITVVDPETEEKKG